MTTPEEMERRLVHVTRPQFEAFTRMLMDNMFWDSEGPGYNSDNQNPEASAADLWEYIGMWLADEFNLLEDEG